MQVTWCAHSLHAGCNNVTALHHSAGLTPHGVPDKLLHKLSIGLQHAALQNQLLFAAGRVAEAAAAAAAAAPLRQPLTSILLTTVHCVLLPALDPASQSCTLLLLPPVLLPLPGCCLLLAAARTRPCWWGANARALHVIQHRTGMQEYHVML